MAFGTVPAQVEHVTDTFEILDMKRYVTSLGAFGGNEGVSHLEVWTNAPAEIVTDTVVRRSQRQRGNASCSPARPDFSHPAEFNRAIVALLGVCFTCNSFLSR